MCVKEGMVLIMKKIIIVLVIILVILITTVIYINYKANSEINDELRRQEEEYINGINNPGLAIDGVVPGEVKIDNIFFTVEECVKTYIQYAIDNNSQMLYALVDYKYIDEHNITEENVNQLFIRDTSNHINKTLEEYGISRTKLCYILCKTQIRN